MKSRHYHIQDPNKVWLGQNGSYWVPVSMRRNTEWNGSDV
jgi:hypothetical protein